MGKKSKKKANAPTPKYRLSSMGTWVHGQADVWTLSEDQRFTLYEGQTPETTGQWFLVERKLSQSAFLFRENTGPITPHFLGDAEGLDIALDLADVEISRRRFEQSRAEV